MSLSERIAMVREYYTRADAGRADFVDFFTDDAEIYFPKYGFGRGRAALRDLAAGLGSSLDKLVHNLDDLEFLPSGDSLVVLGTTSGITKDGRSWAGGVTPAGRFCSIFRFDGDKITGMRVHLDPDYGGVNEAEFLWGLKGRAW